MCNTWVLRSTTNLPNFNFNHHFNQSSTSHRGPPKWAPMGCEDTCGRNCNCNQFWNHFHLPKMVCIHIPSLFVCMAVCICILVCILTVQVHSSPLWLQVILINVKYNQQNLFNFFSNDVNLWTFPKHLTVFKQPTLTFHTHTIPVLDQL